MLWKWSPITPLLKHPSNLSNSALDGLFELAAKKEEKTYRDPGTPAVPINGVEIPEDIIDIDLLEGE